MSRFRRAGARSLVIAAAAALLVSGIALASQPSSQRAGATNRDAAYSNPPSPVETAGGGHHGRSTCELKSVRTHGTHAHLVVSCRKHKGRYTVVLVLHTVRNGHEVTLGKETLRIKGGHHKSTTLELNKAGRKLLKKDGSLSATLSLHVKGSHTTNTRGLSFTHKHHG
jgi:hypothetical protein